MLKSDDRGPVWLLPVVVGVAALAAIALAYLLFAGPDDTSAGEDDGRQGDPGVEEPRTGGPEPALGDVIRREADDPLSMGSVDAPVAMVVYSDYQCPYCAAWNEETLPELMEYVENDQLRIEWRDLSVYGQDSERASLAAYAAGQQDMFWEYHHELFKDGETRQPDVLSEEGLVALAGDLGLDTEKFAADMNSTEALDQVFVNAYEGVQLGASSTPSFVMNDMTLVGAQPTDVFVDAIEEVLLEKDAG